jgi:class 3 adenylate cyclase
MTEQRRLAAIVSADVTGYSRLMGRDETGTPARLKSLRHEVVNPVIASHGGPPNGRQYQRLARWSAVIYGELECGTIRTA